MAEAEQGIIELLRADGTVSGLVSTRAYFAEAPQSAALPFIVLTRISGVRDLVIGGSVDLVDARIQIDYLASTMLAARTIANACRSVLNGYRGTTASTNYQMIKLLDEADANEESDIFRVTADYQVMYLED